MTRPCCWLVAALLGLGCGETFTSSETGDGGANPGGTGGTSSGSGGTAGSGGTGTGGGGTAGGGGSTGESCAAPNSINNLVDPFDGADLGPQWWPMSTGDPGPELMGGYLRLSAASGMAGVHTHDSFDLTGCRIFIDINTLPNHLNYPVEAWFDLVNGNAYMSIFVRGGALWVQVQDGEGFWYEKQFDASASSTRFWRYAEQDGELGFQVAGADGQFHNLDVIDTPAFITNVEVELATWSGTPTNGMGVFTVAGVNVVE